MFSFLNNQYGESGYKKGDVFPYSTALNHYDTYDPDGTPWAPDSTLNDWGTLLTHDNFYSQVIHKTIGLPFLFVPNEAQPDNMAICKFDQKAFSFQQQSPNLYSCKMRIKEVW